MVTRLSAVALAPRESARELTNRIMAFDVGMFVAEDDFNLDTLSSQLSINSLPSDKEISRFRKAALFEGAGERGRQAHPSCAH